MKLRKLALLLHRYVGLAVGLLLLVITLTGSLLIFKDQIDPFLNPALLQVTPQSERVPLSNVLAIVRDSHPNEKLRLILMPQKPDEVYDVRMRSQSGNWVDVYVDPYKGTILGSRLEKHSLMDFLFYLHTELLADVPGAIVVGISGLLLIMVSMTGLILWPDWRRQGLGFKIRWKAPWRVVNYNLHKLIGILSLVFLVIVPSTGAAMIFSDTSQSAIYWLTNTPLPTPPPTSKLAVGMTPLALDVLLPLADTALPNAKTTRIAIPQTPQQTVKVTMKLPQELFPGGHSAVYLDQYSGAVLRIDNALNFPLGTKIWNLRHSFHFGTFGGLTTQIVYVFFGLTPTALLITGFMLWRQRQWDQARRRETRPAAERQQ